VVFAGIQDGHIALIVRGLAADSAGRISVERFESVFPTYTRTGYFLGLNGGHIRAYIKSHRDWEKQDYSTIPGSRPQFVEMEIKAHPDLAGLPISELQIDNRGNIIWLANGACDVRRSD
jgi:hypothetical protein